MFIQIRESVCPICGKKFVIPPQTIYRIVVKRGKTAKVNYYCSYTCFRVAQKEKEAKRKYKKDK